MAAARMLLQNKFLPQFILRQILSPSDLNNVILRNIAKDKRIVQSLFAPSQELCAQKFVPVFGEMDSVIGSSGWRNQILEGGNLQSPAVVLSSPGRWKRQISDVEDEYEDEEVIDEDNDFLEPSDDSDEFEDSGDSFDEDFDERKKK